MDKEKVKEIASKGGQTTHKGENHDDHSKSGSHNKKDHDQDHHGKQGFASMDKEKVKEIASKGGQTSNKNKQIEMKYDQSFFTFVLQDLKSNKASSRITKNQTVVPYTFIVIFLSIIIYSLLQFFPEFKV